MTCWFGSSCFGAFGPRTFQILPSALFSPASEPCSESSSSALGGSSSKLTIACALPRELLRLIARLSGSLSQKDLCLDLACFLAPLFAVRLGGRYRLTKVEAVAHVWSPLVVALRQTSSYTRIFVVTDIVVLI